MARPEKYAVSRSKQAGNQSTKKPGHTPRLGIMKTLRRESGGQDRLHFRALEAAANDHHAKETSD